MTVFVTGRRLCAADVVVCRTVDFLAVDVEVLRCVVLAAFALWDALRRVDTFDGVRLFEALDLEAVDLLDLLDLVCCAWSGAETRKNAPARIIRYRRIFVFSSVIRKFLPTGSAACSSTKLASKVAIILQRQR